MRARARMAMKRKEITMKMVEWVGDRRIVYIVEVYLILDNG
jgi:hypothetical protein